MLLSGLKRREAGEEHAFQKLKVSKILLRRLSFLSPCGPIPCFSAPLKISYTGAELCPLDNHNPQSIRFLFLPRVQKYVSKSLPSPLISLPADGRVTEPQSCNPVSPLLFPALTQSSGVASGVKGSRDQQTPGMGSCGALLWSVVSSAWKKPECCGHLFFVLSQSLPCDFTGSWSCR